VFGTRQDRPGNALKRRILLQKVDLFDTQQGALTRGVDVLVEGADIVEVGCHVDIGDAGTERIDGRGKFALPGLFECHGHLAGLTVRDEPTRAEVAEEFPDLALKAGDDMAKAVLSQFVNRGITQVRDAGGPVDTLRQLKDDISSGKYTGPDIFYAGPMLEKSPLTWENHNECMPGFSVAVNTVKDAGDIVEQLAAAGVSCIKTFNNFDTDVFTHVVERAAAHGLRVLHDPGAVLFQSVPMDLGIEIGIRCFEHGKSPWPVVLTDGLKRELMALRETSADEQGRMAFAGKLFALGVKSVSSARLTRLVERMVEKEVCFCPTLNVFTLFLEDESKKGNQDMIKRLSVLMAMQSHFVKQMIRGGVRILVGHDGYNPEFTVREMELLSGLGLSPEEIIRGATLYPAEWLGVADRYGNVSAGRRANIVILERDPLEDIRNVRAVCTVLQGGNVVFPGREP